MGKPSIADRWGGEIRDQSQHQNLLLGNLMRQEVKSLFLSNTKVVETIGPKSLDWSKLNFDAALRGPRACAAIVCRNSAGVFEFGCTAMIDTSHPEEAEAYAALLAISTALSQGKLFVLLAGDAVEITDLLRDDSLSPGWRIRSFILQPRLLLTKFSGWEVEFSPRLANCASHNLAADAFFCNHSGFVPSSSTLLFNLEEDRNNVTL